MTNHVAVSLRLFLLIQSSRTAPARWAEVGASKPLSSVQAAAASCQTLQLFKLSKSKSKLPKLSKHQQQELSSTAPRTPPRHASLYARVRPRWRDARHKLPVPLPSASLTVVAPAWCHPPPSPASGQARPSFDKVPGRFQGRTVGASWQGRRRQERDGQTTT